jgi:response regulator RpfG family c-di-GMP phosphodiesterase
MRKGPIPKVLIVDDEDQIRELCVESLEKFGYSAIGASNGEQAMELVAQGRFSVVLLDIRMPGLDGIETLKRLKLTRPELQVLMITGYGSVESSVEAMKHGACDYILKPFNLEELALRVRRCLEEQQAQTQIASLTKQVHSLMLGTIGALVKAAEAKSLYTRGHSDRVSRYSLEIASYYALPDETRKESLRRTIVLSGLLHDIGKIGLPDHVLNAPCKVGDEQWELIKRHPVIGARILSGIPPLKETLPGVVYHHCHFNNPAALNSYPPGRAGRRIPVQARIISVADTFDALTTTRPYRRAVSKYEAVQIIEGEAGRQFDPEAVKAFLCAFDVCFAVWQIGEE